MPVYNQCVIFSQKLRLECIHPHYLGETAHTNYPYHIDDFEVVFYGT